jgi:hypothetical protein
MSYWIRTFLGVNEADLDTLPLGYAQLNREAKDAYVDLCFLRWRESAIVRLKTSHGFNWSCLGLQGEQEAMALLRFLSDGRDRKPFQDWLLDELGHIEDEPRASTLREQVAVALGNFIRTGQVTGRGRRSVENPQESLLRYVEWENDQTSYVESPHYVAVICPFLEMLRELPAPKTKRSPQPGDAELAAIWTK